MAELEKAQAKDAAASIDDNPLGELSELDRELEKLQREAMNIAGELADDSPSEDTNKTSNTAFVRNNSRASFNNAEKTRIRRLLPKEFRELLKSKRYPISKPLDFMGGFVPFFKSIMS